MAAALLMSVTGHTVTPGRWLMVPIGLLALALRVRTLRFRDEEDTRARDRSPALGFGTSSWYVPYLAVTAIGFGLLFLGSASSQGKEVLGDRMGADRSLARTTRFIFYGVWIVAFAAMGLTSYLAGTSPSPPWMIVFGALALVFGLHTLYFRAPDTEAMQQSRAREGVPTPPGFSELSTVMLFGLAIFLIYQGFTR